MITFQTPEIGENLPYLTSGKFLYQEIENVTHIFNQIVMWVCGM